MATWTSWLLGVTFIFEEENFQFSIVERMRGINFLRNGAKFLWFITPRLIKVLL